MKFTCSVRVLKPDTRNVFPKQVAIWFLVHSTCSLSVIYRSFPSISPLLLLNVIEEADEQLVVSIMGSR